MVLANPPYGGKERQLVPPTFFGTDESRGHLEVRVHPFSNPRSNRAIEHLLDQLNASEMKYPGTSLTLTYSLIGVTKTETGIS